MNELAQKIGELSASTRALELSQGRIENNIEKMAESFHIVAAEIRTESRESLKRLDERVDEQSSQLASNTATIKYMKWLVGLLVTSILGLGGHTVLKDDNTQHKPPPAYYQHESAKDRGR